MPSKTIDIAKAAAAQAASTLIQDGMIVGLGTGSTAAFFISFLVDRCRNGLNIQAVASSEKSHQQALAGGIKMADINTLTSIDFTVDGADEIDPQKRMIKGGGGALLREKIVASMSKEMIVIVDEAKHVKQLGKHPLPVEIIPFAHEAIIYKLNQVGYQGILRKTSSDQRFMTDSGNYIYDISFKNLLTDPEDDHLIIKNIPGVVETGLFLNLAGRVITGFSDGHVEFQS